MEYNILYLDRLPVCPHLRLPHEAADVLVVAALPVAPPVALQVRRVRGEAEGAPGEVVHLVHVATWSVVC